jgi:hypothetical protein
MLRAKGYQIHASEGRGEGGVVKLRMTFFRFD